jgi:hypothetical protein
VVDAEAAAVVAAAGLSHVLDRSRALSRSASELLEAQAQMGDTDAMSPEEIMRLFRTQNTRGAASQESNSGLAPTHRTGDGRASTGPTGAPAPGAWAPVDARPDGIADPQLPPSSPHRLRDALRQAEQVEARRQRDAARQRSLRQARRLGMGDGAALDYEALPSQVHQLHCPHEGGGASRRTINQLPTFVHRVAARGAEPGSSGEASGVSAECMICMCAFRDGDVLRMLPCMHKYHVDCVDRWLDMKETCPICHTAITQR